MAITLSDKDLVRVLIFGFVPSGKVKSKVTSDGQTKLNSEKRPLSAQFTRSMVWLESVGKWVYAHMKRTQLILMS